MSFNLRYDNDIDGENCWENRKLPCAEMIKGISPDVFGIQEGLEEQVNFLDSILENYAWIGIGRDSLSIQNEYSAIFYKKDEFELLESGTFWLSETPTISSKGWDAKFPRIVTWVILKSKQSGKKALVVNTHLDHKGMVAQQQSIKLIIDRVKQQTKDGMLTFVMGDFNALPGNPIFEPILEFMYSARAEACKTDSVVSYNGFGIENDTKIIDHIFYLGATADTFQTITKNYGVSYLSDHYPIVADFTLH
ncbi:endonuclease/exonuclease/phosphatase family protein [Sunxiuqinia sp. A32]|uniref:endonuclease/exonuclease/phosphatase family protein n=1 Tax=Sunxiuqinia sp. A32 TaxID=3461496 RepID=UPI004045D5E7